MKTEKSITRRVFLSFGGFTLCLSFVYSAFCLFIAYAVEDALLERVIELEADYIRDVFQNIGTVVAPRVDYVRLYDGIQQAPRAVADALQSSPGRTEIFTKTRDHYHVQFLALDDRETRLLVAEVSPLLIVSNMSRDIFFLSVMVLLTGLILSVWLAWRITLKTVQPVTRLAGEVMKQQDSDRPVQLTAGNDPDEIGYLAATIEQALRHHKEALQREKDFTRDVSHELRTPLTVIKNTLALAENREWKTENRQQLQDAADRMGTTVSALLALARSESLQKETLYLRPLLEECVLNTGHALEEDGFEITLDVPDRYTIDANRQLVTLLVTNLIENAVSHASRMSLQIILRDNDLVFENDIDRDLAENIVDPSVKGPDSSGLGQGLYLASRIIDVLGWQYKISTADNRYRFSLITT